MEKDNNIFQLNELKLVLIGDGSVGKTSLAKNLINDNSFSSNESTTHGISVSKWNIQTENKAIDLNVWDFGGQAIFHAAFQLFLTERSIYLVVVDERSGYGGDIEYWLKLIQTFGASSPVIIVVTHSERKRFEFDWLGLQRKYKNIKSIHQVSNKTGEGISELRSSIISEAKQFKDFQAIAPENWVNVKNRIDELGKDFISFNSYVEICLSQGIKNEQDCITLLMVLHDIGFLIWFSNNEKLKKIIILNPEWLMNGIVTLIENRDINESQGLISIKQINRLFDKKRFPLETHPLIMDLLVDIEFCAKLADGENYLISNNIPAQSPNINWNYTDGISFHYYYNFLPKTLIIRFISRIYPLVYNEMYWKTGVVLEYQENQALILADFKDNRIHIYIKGEHGARQEFLFNIRSHFNKIHLSINNLEVKEMIELPDYPEKFIDYTQVISLYKQGEQSFFSTGLSQKIDLNYLIELLEPQQKIDEIEIDKKPLKVFLCHASTDKPKVRDLYNRLIKDKVDPWFDEKKLLPGQDWQLEIPKAVRQSHIVVICLSSSSVSKTGYVQKEIKYALDVADEQPEGAIYLIPLRLEECDVPTRLQKWQWVDFYKNDGYQRLLLALTARANYLGFLPPRRNDEKDSA